MGGGDSLLDTGAVYKRDDAEFDRAIGFVDATYALALTLLVTTLDIDDVASAWSSPGSLFDAVGAQFIAFAIAFAVIANYWVVHHRMISAFAAIDYPTIVANLFLIAAIVLLPFSTQSVGDPSIDDLALPTVVMAANVALASLLHSTVFGMGVRRGLLARSRPRRGGPRLSRPQPAPGDRLHCLDPGRLRGLAGDRARGAGSPCSPST